MIKNFDRNNLRALRADLDAALSKIASAHGIVLSVGSATFNPASATFKLHAALLAPGAAEGEKSAMDVKAWDDYQHLATLYGCRPEWLGKSFRSPTSGEEFTVTGLKRSSPKYPILVVRNSDEKRFKFRSEQVRKGFLGSTS